MMIRPKTMRVGFFFSVGVLGFAQSTHAETALTTVMVADGLSSPLFVTAPPEDFNRLFVVERGGRIEIVKNGALVDVDFLSIASRLSTGGERGLLGMAFHPDYAATGEFFLNYTNLEGDIELARFHVSADPDVGDPSGEPVLVVDHPNVQRNHYGGWIEFGPDGYLYMSVGDALTSAESAQDIEQNLLGKILRLDVDGDDFPLDPDRNYAIPPSNPFVGVAGDDEIFVYGLRNPWRCGFDRETGDLFIGDVGTSNWEEINVVPASGTAGLNFGWPLFEGPGCKLGPCDPIGLTFPIHAYSHSDPNVCAVAGGEVYRGCAIPDLQGTYFFGDFCSGQVWSLRYDGAVTDLRERTAELDPPGSATLGTVVSFGHDAAGELYLCDLAGGVVRKIVAAPLPAMEGISLHDGAIDARRPLAVVNDSKFLSGWTELTMRLDPPSPCPRHEAFYLRTVGGSLAPPELVELEPLSGQTFRLRWDRYLEVLAWTEIVHEDSHRTLRLGMLPADVNADGIADSRDVLDLRDTFLGIGPALPEWSVDLDRSTAATPADILEAVDLLLGISGFPPFDGRSLP